MKEKIISISAMLVLLSIGSVVLYPTPKSSVRAHSMPQMTNMDHTGVANGAVDGRVTPALIKDRDAYRLVFVSLSSNVKGVDNLADASFLKGVFGQVSDAQISQIQSVLLSFRAGYNQLVSNYTAGVQGGVHGDLNSFRNTRDALVLETRQEIEAVLGPTGTQNFLNYIRSEKSNMVVGLEDSGPNE